MISVDAIHGGLLRAIGARGPQGILVYCVAVGGNCPPYSRNCSDGEGGLVVADGGGYARLGDGDVFRLALNADEVAALRDCCKGHSARAHEGVHRHASRRADVARPPAGERERGSCAVTRST